MFTSASTNIVTHYVNLNTCRRSHRSHLMESLSGEWRRGFLDNHAEVTESIVQNNIRHYILYIFGFRKKRKKETEMLKETGAVTVDCSSDYQRRLDLNTLFIFMCRNSSRVTIERAAIYFIDIQPIIDEIINDMWKCFALENSFNHRRDLCQSSTSGAKRTDKIHVKLLNFNWNNTKYWLCFISESFCLWIFNNWEQNSTNTETNNVSNVISDFFYITKYLYFN